MWVLFPENVILVIVKTCKANIIW